MPYEFNLGGGGLYLDFIIFGILRHLREFGGKACEKKHARNTETHFHALVNLFPRVFSFFSAAIVENEKALGTS